MSSNVKLHATLILKKIRDMKLKAKIRIFLFSITILTVCGIGFYSYQIAKNELIRNSKDAVMSIEKQGARNLDDRINSFFDVSYRILQSSNIVKLLNYSKEEAESFRTANDGMASVISQQSSLAEYTKYALLKPSSGMIYDYYKSGVKKLGKEKEALLLERMDGLVDRKRPVCWTVYEDEVYFVRQIVTPDFEEKGILCFAVNDSFFEFMSDDMEYLGNDNVIVLNRNRDRMKYSGSDIAETILLGIEAFDDEEYYVYNTEMDVEGDVYSVAVIHTPANDWTIISYFSHAVLLKGIDTIFKAILNVILLAVCLVLLITAMISRTITKNVILIEEGMRHYERGEFDFRISPASYDEVGLLGLQLNYMALKISSLIGQLHIEEEEKKRLEIETLQAQINPHFLYNTLGSLKWAAVRQKQSGLADSLDALSSLLEFTIKKAGGMVTIEEEVNYIKHYIEIEKMRYGERFAIEYQIDEADWERKIPGFLLQPLVENSFLHGLDLTKEGGKIVIRGYEQVGYLCLEVEDNGIGMTKEKAAELLEDKKPEKKYKGFNSIGIQIVDKRLRELYGPDYHTEINSTVGKGTRITLWIPLLGKGEGDGIQSTDC